MARLSGRRALQLLLILFSVFLAGTVVFLSAVNVYFSIDSAAIIQPGELGSWEEDRGMGDHHRLPWSPEEKRLSEATAEAQKDAAAAIGYGDEAGRNVLPHGRDNVSKPWDPKDPPEKIPRIIHQTWKDALLPPKWQAMRDECSQMHPDYQYMLWTDADSRKFLVEHYPWFVAIFDAYPYPIQRADAIRYFVLYHYGGIYMDLDVGCHRPCDPLLRFEVVLPKTIPVGVSNDVMLAAKGHAFMDYLIHNLVTFNHRYVTHYPTVMFSTGPMFVSTSYRLYANTHGQTTRSTPWEPAAGFSGVRILPKALYGKNAAPSEVPDAFFRHFYGSSWHANDASSLIFLRDHGRFFLVLSGCIVLYGLARSSLKSSHDSTQPRRCRGGSGRSTLLPLSSENVQELQKNRDAGAGSSARSAQLGHLNASSQMTDTSPSSATAAAIALAG